MSLEPSTRSMEPLCLRAFSAQADPVQMHPGLHGIKPEAEAAKPKETEEQQSTYWLMQPVYSPDYLRSVTPKHLPVESLHQRVGHAGVQLLRRVFDAATGYGHDMTPERWLRRFIFLETVAGVPGFVAGMLRHMRSLRSMKRDNGWIHTLLEEAENERMHLLTFLNYRQPGPIMRGLVLLGQGVFLNAYLLAYTLSPRTCHSFVGYLEEEAVKTYTRALEDMDAGRLPEWKDLPAPKIAQDYWKLPEGATMYELLLNVRADEACHSHVNHTFAELKPNDTNPFVPGTVHLP
ncbi:hypothetical protein QBZ16_005147 [Prototheca wickerhamii]|uniref:Ubiquinol oxidase n=1 Tax=Prototheca wickerhamii TaxID=3111 RepID=A0AAD9MGH7_PROWI|nr:hypothetical protein QBZ16_005147 [Prototheca wickerhamii]